MTNEEMVRVLSKDIASVKELLTYKLDTTSSRITSLEESFCVEMKSVKQEQADLEAAVKGHQVWHNNIILKITRTSLKLVGYVVISILLLFVGRLDWASKIMLKIF